MFQTIFEWVLLPVWFSLPGMIAHTVPNKHWTALPLAMLAAHVTLSVQRSLFSYPLPDAPWLILVICFGLGAFLSKWVTPSLKHLLGVKSADVRCFEKVDFLVMSYLFLWILGVALPVQYYVVPIMLMCITHGPGNRFAYQMGWRNSPY